MRIFLAPLAVVLAFATPQTPKGQEPAKPRPGVFEAADVQAARAREGILGAWQLTRGEIPAFGVGGGGVAGYALFMDGYMSMEIHVVANKGSRSAETLFQTGTHRWMIEDNGTLDTYGLIGTHNITEDEEYDFEPPGERRSYRVQFEGDHLVLERTDRSSRLTFTRLGKLRFPDGKDAPGLDFYGRPIKPKEGDAKK